MSVAERTSEMREQLLDAYQEAVGLALLIDRVPRWRWRKRARMEARYRLCCDAADTLREDLGGRLGAPGLDVIIKSQMEDLESGEMA